MGAVSRICFLWALVLSTAIVTIRLAASESDLQGRSAEGTDQVRHPKPPLEDALIAYASTTGIEVFVDHALVAGQRSAPVQGVFGFEAGLQRLLTGTGLKLRRAASQAYTLTATQVPEPRPDRLPGWSTDSKRGQYFAALQAAVKATLCARPETAPGSYRAALAIWIGPSGSVVGVRMLGATEQEQPVRDMLDDIKHINVGQPPPPGLEQPVTFVILPRPPDQTGDCDSRRASRG